MASVEQTIRELDACTDLTSLQRYCEALEEQTDGNLHELLGDDDRYSLASALQAYYAARCKIQAALAMLALADYHADHRRFPARLAELVPRYLSHVPVDYWDRQPLRYTVSVDSYLLYSIGRNGEDDEGAAAGANPSSVFTWKSPDVVFSATERDEWRWTR